MPAIGVPVERGEQVRDVLQRDRPSFIHDFQAEHALGQFRFDLDRPIHRTMGDGIAQQVGQQLRNTGRITRNRAGGTDGQLVSYQGYHAAQETGYRGSSLMSAPVILVVEDEPLLRLSAVLFLKEEGFEALEARDAEAAIGLLERRSDVTLVFTDVDMGEGKDGLWLAAQVHDTWPPIRIIITSGHRHVGAEMLPDGAVFIPKPYAEEDVVGTIRQLTA